MNIEDVKTAIKVATIIEKNDNNKNRKYLWDIKWNDKINKFILKDNAGRVYLIVSNKIIMKIGGSQQTGGIKSTISTYKNCANSGRPSDRTYGIHIFIREEMNKGNIVEIYMIKSDEVKAPVKGLFGYNEELVSPFKEMERKCLMDYFKIEGEYPKWNLQERNEPWPKYIQEGNPSRKI